MEFTGKVKAAKYRGRTYGITLERGTDDFIWFKRKTDEQERSPLFPGQVVTIEGELDATKGKFTFVKGNPPIIKIEGDGVCRHGSLRHDGEGVYTCSACGVEATVTFAPVAVA